MKKTEEKYVPHVLTELSMLKEDAPSFVLEGCQRKTGFVGVHNFREIENIFGLSQPTEEGIRNLVKFYREKIIWINLREEPVIYINGLPFVLRDRKAPFSNIKSFEGISYKRIEEMEERLKKDIEQISLASDGFIQVYAERAPKTMWVNNICVREVKTVKDVFHAVDGVRYYRIPITRMHMRETFISALHTVLAANRKESSKFKKFSIGFNCGTGIEKTSYGMSACMVYKILSRDTEKKHKEGEIPVFSKAIKVLEKVHSKDKISDFLIKTGNIVPVLEKALKGKYTIIERLLHALDLPDVKDVVNGVLERIGYSLLSNLLEKVLVLQGEANVKVLRKAAVFLERYISLILYGTYIKEQMAQTFSEWIDGSSIIQGVIKEISIKTPNKAIFLPVIISQKRLADEEWSAIIGASTVLQADRNLDASLQKRISHQEESSSFVFEMYQPNINTDLSFLKPSTIWINLRAEPVVYIKGIPHSERDRINPNHNIRSPTGITDELVNNQEAILIRRIRNEGNQQQGEILLFLTETNKIKTRRVNVKEKAVQTCKEFFSRIPEVKYMRIPMGSKAPLNPNTIDALYSVIVSNPGTHIVLQASGWTGRGRTMAILANTIIRIRQLAQERAEIENASRPALIRPIETLIRILSNGTVSEIVVREVWARVEGRDIYEMHRTGEIYSSHLINYILLVSLGSYILEKNTESFRKWINQRKDILNLYKTIEDVEESSRKVSKKDLSPLSQKEPHRSTDELINRPWGQVLTPHTILKNDFFPALRILKTEKIDIKGCCNFRTIQFKGDITVGVAQPTAWGVQSLIAYFNPFRSKETADDTATDTPDGTESARRIYWFCLRQEPVVYVNGFPFVFRTTDLIYENVITEGINREWIEDTEERMKNDCLDESIKDGLILHNEEIVDNEPRLVAEISVTSNILTPKEVFVNKDLAYFRVPISDEQTPLPEIFDDLHQIILSIPKPRILVFSCQMGRGRTTTGMVIARLIAFIEHIEGLDEKQKKQILEEKRSSVLYEDRYRIITKLVQVLPMGRESKNLVDSIVKECSHVQNIYEAITQRTVSTGYLMRYFYLICFASFLLERKEKTFSQYLSNRIEIDAIANEREY